jgi:hypothetical protein
MKTYLVFAAALAAAALARGAEPVRPFELEIEPVAQNEIDHLVASRLNKLQIQPARICSDAVFLRRVCLDTIGTLPTEEEVRRFLSDRSPDKRRLLIDQLLEREEFADYWALKWGDLLRIKAEFPINLWPNAVQAYHRWIRTSIVENKPYDRFVREILTSSGSNFRVPPVNFYRSMQTKEPSDIATAIALTFMGERTENWPEERLEAMAAFFARIGYKTTAEWKEEIVFDDAFRTTGDAAPVPDSAAFPDGQSIRLTHERDPRAVFADWLINPENPWFTRNIVNRVWYWLQGQGIIHEPDDMRPDNPPSNPELLAFLEEELVTAGYDLKHLFRIILNSSTYQLSSIPRSEHPQAKANFAYYPLRRLDAEVLIDAICQITESNEEYSSPIPEPFSFIPEDQRSIALPDGSITSSFLEMFGRPPRDTGLESERNNRSTAAQRLHMLNSSHIRDKIQRMQSLPGRMRMRRDPRAIVTSLYLRILSRFPTDEELRAVQSYVQSGEVQGLDVLVDLAWALINSTEFLYRH